MKGRIVRPPLAGAAVFRLRGRARAAAGAARILLRVVRRLLFLVRRGQLARYSFIAETNTVGEAGLAVAALLGRIPLRTGPHIQEYERRFAAAVGTRFAFSFASGRMAFYVLLEALQIGPGDEVIIPAFTCVVVPNAILYRGARPIYVDIRPDTYNINTDLIEAAITPRTRAIVAQHTFGLIAGIEAITRIAQKHHLVVLEDCAHSLGATYGGRSAGSLGTAAYFSTDRTKITSTGTGGMVTTDDEALAAAVAAIYRRSPFLSAGRVRMGLLAFAADAVLFHPRIAVVGTYVQRLLWTRFLRRGMFSDELSLAKPASYPYPARLSNTQALIGLRQLAKLPENLERRRRTAEQYESEIGACGGLLEASYANHAFLRYTFAVQDRKEWEERFEDLFDVWVWFTSVAHGRDHDLELIDYTPGSCPVAERAAEQCFNLPTHTRIAPDRILDLLRRLRGTGWVEASLVDRPQVLVAR